MKKSDFLYFVGIDVSKHTFDVAIINGETIKSFLFDNSIKGVKAFLKLLKNQRMPLNETLICMEHTGIYGNLLITKLLETEAVFCVEMSLRITRSLGIQRGKNDKIDAIRIAQYAVKNCNEMEMYKPIPEILEKIKILIKAREQLVNFKADLNKYPNEVNHFAPELGKLAEKQIRKTNKCLDDEIKRIEADLQAFILADEKLNTTVGLVTSVTGIGIMTALYLIIFTNFFTRYQEAKQLACYCGVVPFEHTSGSSVQKRSRVHHMANKTMKRHLHMCALSAVRYDPELKIYYKRKADEGKNKMLILNNVRNKLILRVCAVIKRQKPYQKSVA
ncbi:IS110 family transposase [Mariniflexile gromovii]|uniref:IS110 family transposase n=1 Tax=Mariniflexile gromovii TaxID=362523 RepID=A0ABS4BUG1_9FLAO|nr:IS110 family transposase [Mariniflexile gromovii]MBP0904033.1 IS110 family transposase [Mariniflexile gromovii]